LKFFILFQLFEENLNENFIQVLYFFQTYTSIKRQIQEEEEEEMKRHIMNKI
jgi:hypothetical protein